jgi:hypothetical protein
LPFALRPMKPAERGDATPPAAAEPSAVATVGKQVESIPPGDPAADVLAITEAGEAARHRSRRWQCRDLLAGRLRRPRHHGNSRSLYHAARQMM